MAKVSKTAIPVALPKVLPFRPGPATADIVVRVEGREGAAPAVDVPEEAEADLADSEVGVPVVEAVALKVPEAGVRSASDWED